MLFHRWEVHNEKDFAQSLDSMYCGEGHALKVQGQSFAQNRPQGWEITDLSFCYRTQTTFSDCDVCCMEQFGILLRGLDGRELQSRSKVVGTMLTEYEITSYCFTSRLSLTLWVAMMPPPHPLPPNQCWCELVVFTYCCAADIPTLIRGRGKLVSSQHL